MDIINKYVLYSGFYVAIAFAPLSDDAAKTNTVWGLIAWFFQIVLISLIGYFIVENMGSNGARFNILENAVFKLIEKDTKETKAD